MDRRPEPRWWPAPAILSLCFLVPRAWIYTRLAGESWKPDGYPEALATHFWDFIWSTTLLPPLNHAILKVPLTVLGLERAQQYHGYLLTTWALDAIALICIWRAIVILGGSRPIATCFAAFYSLLLITFELWRANYPSDHRDHATVAMTAFVALAIALGRRRQTAGAIVTLGVVSALYTLQASTAIAAVPAMLVALAVSLPRSAWTGLLNQRAALLVAACLLFGAPGFLVVRAWASTGTFQLSTRQGSTIASFVQEAYDYDDARVRRLAEASGAPPWYLWCFDHARSYVPPGDPAAEGWRHMAKAYGTCMRFTVREPGIENRPWPFDYSELLTYLSTQPDSAALRVAREDDRDTHERQYLFFGSSPEMAPKWVALYGAQSQKIAVALLMTDPARYFRTIWREHLRFAHGAEYFATAGDQLHTQEYPFRLALAGFDRYVGMGVLLTIYASFPVVVVVSVARIYRRTPTSSRAWDYLVLASPTGVLALMFSAVAATDNGRYFVQITPFVIVIGALLASDLSRRAHPTVAAQTDAR